MKDSNSVLKKPSIVNQIFLILAIQGISIGTMYLYLGFLGACLGALLGVFILDVIDKLIFRSDIGSFPD